LPISVAAFDVNLGCSGYPYGLWLAAMMIEVGAANNVLILVGDTISKIVSDDDRSTAMLFGDCGSATLVERCEGHNPMTFVLGTDGSGAQNLIVPKGGFRNNADSDQRNLNPSDKLFMEGGEIFNFTLKAVPALVDALRSAALKDGECFDYYLFHQANTFMIKHLAKKAKVPPEMVPMNIDRFGNTSSATIPLLVVTECRDAVMSDEGKIFGLFGFGVGYSWGACATNMSSLTCADLVVLA
jgi:3-oxoacyl-[acyl-carrier-protein] synthase III